MELLIHALSIFIHLKLQSAQIRVGSWPLSPRHKNVIQLALILDVFGEFRRHVSVINEYLILKRHGSRYQEIF